MPGNKSANKPTILRFAPSPTGRLHIGNIRTALINWLYAQKSGGQFILRLDDTDAERSTAAFAQGIQDDLTWLGLNWDRMERQSDRFERYDAVVEELKRAGRLYACYEAQDELERKRKRQRARGLPPVYDRAGLKLSDDEKAKLEQEGRRPHWRFLLDAKAAGDTSAAGDKTGEAAGKAGAEQVVSWTDLVRGDQSVDLASLSDPVLIREDGSYLYTLCSVIDDIDFGVTHIVRGEDHVTNSGAQVAIFEALGGKAPEFAHHSLLIGADGKGLSKRLGSLSIAGFRELGLEPMSVASHAALIGTSDPLQPHRTLKELADLFEFSKLSRAPGRFDVDELKLLNAKLLHQLDYKDVADRLADLGVSGGEKFWYAVKDNLAVFLDAQDWGLVIDGDIAPVIEDKEFCATAAALLPDEPWDDTTWGSWTKAVKEASGAKGRALFHPLRLALTGRDKGPELKALLPLIGKKRATKRLSDN